MAEPKVMHGFERIGAVAPEDQVHELPGLLPNLTGVILAGGASRRMGQNKAVMPYGGVPLIERIFRQMSQICVEIVVVTNTPELYPFLPCPKVKDEIPGVGPLAGIHSALKYSRTRYIAVVACDMPWMSTDLIRTLALNRDGSDVVVPEGEKGMEPLHAVYSKNCLPAIEKAIAGGKGRIISFFEDVKVKVMPLQQTAEIDPSLRAFRNINTVQDYLALEKP